MARESSRVGARDERFAADADRVDRIRGDRFGDRANRSRASQLTRATPRNPREAIPVDCAHRVIGFRVSDHPASGPGTIGFVTERSSGGGAPGSSSWANARATLTARSLARWPEPIVSKQAVRLLDYSALANGDSCRRLLSPESKCPDAARRQTHARA